MTDYVKKYGLPRKMVSCPYCGDLYGTKNRQVCVNCEECSKCCECLVPKFVSVEAFITQRGN